MASGDSMWSDMLETERRYKNATIKTTYWPNMITNPSNARQRPWADSYCQALMDHESGHWQHYLLDDPSDFKNGRASLLNDTSIHKMYFPKEMEWIKGKNLQNFGTCTQSINILMYNSNMGHQCGCGVRGFRPTHSVWVRDNTTKNSIGMVKQNTMNSATTTFPTSSTNHHDNSPTFRLVKHLASVDGTLCFAGDSMDFQIYNAMQNNLIRLMQLHQIHNFNTPKPLSIVSREIPVNHTTEPGNINDWYLHGHRPPDGDGSFLHGRRPPPGGFGSMYSILETKAFFSDGNSSQVRRARIRYYMTYGWSPWNVDFMEECNIVIMNLGFHYSSEGDHIGRWNKHPLMDDVRAAITYLTNFTAARKNRISVWRSALPQHFDTYDGHFQGWDKLPKGQSCTAIKNSSSRNQLSRVQQVYNSVYDEVFALMCHSLWLQFFLVN